MSPPLMPAADVVRLVDLIERTGATVWLDGGWAVDALLGERTRSHGDLDVAIEVADRDRVVAALESEGFGPAWRGDTSDWNFALGDRAGREVDLHLFTEGSTGLGWYGPPDAQVAGYPTHARAGRGTVDGREVRCLTAPWLVRYKTGYDVDADDWHDVQRLCERFDLGVPPDYDRFRPARVSGTERVTVSPSGPVPDDVEHLLRLLPDWFGIESAIEEYVADAARMTTVVARDDDGHPVGVLLLADHDPCCPEVHLMAVHPVWHRHGVGRRLVAAAETLARDRGERLLSVKTLGPSRPHAGYDRTRAFYLAAGFLPVEELVDHYPGNPFLVLVKPL